MWVVYVKVVDQYWVCQVGDIYYIELIGKSFIFCVVLECYVGNIFIYKNRVVSCCVVEY